MPVIGLTPPCGTVGCSAIRSNRSRSRFASWRGTAVNCTTTCGGMISATAHTRYQRAACQGLASHAPGRSHLARRGATVPRKDSTRSARRTTEHHGEDECAAREAPKSYLRGPPWFFVSSVLRILRDCYRHWPGRSPPARSAFPKRDRPVACTAAIDQPPRRCQLLNLNSFGSNHWRLGGDATRAMQDTGDSGPAIQPAT